MLYALANPYSLLVLLTSFLVGVTLHGWVQSLVATRVGDPRPGQQQRLKPDPRRHVDPFGAVAAGLTGLGWARPVELVARQRRGAVVAVALSGPAVNLLLGAGLLLAFRFGDYGVLLGDPPLATWLREGVVHGSASPVATALVLGGLSQLFLGALSLVPLPPLDGGRLLFAFAPRSPGWQKAEHYLAEQNIGVAVVLALVLIPLGSGVPPLPALLEIVLGPLVTLLTRG